MKQSVFFVLISALVFCMSFFSTGLTVLGADYPPAVIESQPKDTAAEMNKVGAFDIVADNVLSYQWYLIPAGEDVNDTSNYMKLHDGDIVNGEFKLSGATEDFLIVPSYDETHESRYICELVGYDGNTVWSEPAILTVNGLELSAPVDDDPLGNDTDTTEDDVAEPVVKSEEGCGSMISGSCALIIVIAGAAVLPIRRKSEN